MDLDRFSRVPFKCDVRDVIRFLHAEGYSVAEIHQRMSNVHGEPSMSEVQGVIRFLQADEILGYLAEEASSPE